MHFLPLSASKMLAQVELLSTCSVDQAVWLRPQVQLSGQSQNAYSKVTLLKSVALFPV